jgi:hypothetical protein
VSANTYLGLEALRTYDANLCAEYCNNKTLGTDFNIVAERDACLNFSDTCTQPASSTEYKCTLRGSGVDTASATNCGGYRGQSQTAIAGSDDFEKTNTNTPAQKHQAGKQTNNAVATAQKDTITPTPALALASSQVRTTQLSALRTQKYRMPSTKSRLSGGSGLRF